MSSTRRTTARWAGAVLAGTVLAGTVLAGAVLALLVVPVARPAAAAAAAPDRFYGTWYDAMSPAPAEARTQLDAIAAAGIGTIRQYVFWDRIETSPGQYDWARFDQEVTDATARGLTILPTLLYTPSFYSSKPPGSTSTAQFPPSDPQTLARFATAMIERYGPDGAYWCTPSPIPTLPPTCKNPTVPLRAWEVWNEPNYSSWWKGAPNPAEYAQLLHAVSAAVHQADPGAEVVIGALQNVAPAPGGFLEQLYGLGAGPDFDTLSINPYAYDVGKAVDYVRGTRAMAATHGDAAKPIRVTEYGWATGGRSTVTVVDEACQAALLSAATSRLAGLRSELGLAALIQFQWSDVATTSTSWPYYAGLNRPDGTAKPALAAQREAIAGRPAPAGSSLVEGCPPERRTDSVYRDAVRAGTPVAYLRLGEASDSSAAADDRATRPGTYSTSTGRGATGALTHDVDTSASFAGTDAVDLGSGPLLLGRYAMTFEAWVRTAARTPQVLYLERPPSGAGVVRVGVSGPGATDKLRLVFQEAVKGAALQTVVGSTTITDGGWHHVVVTRRSTAVALFVDGVLDRSATLSSARTTASPPAATRVALGRDLVAGRAGLVGGLDEVAVYRTALTAQQVAQHWAAR